VLYRTANNESIPSAQFKCFAEAIYFQMSTHNVDNLIVGMAVHRSSPAFHHLVFGKKKLVVVGQHATCEAGFRMRFLGLVAGYHNKIRISSVLRFHFVASVQCLSAARSDLAAMGFLASFTSCAYRVAKLLINSGLRS
jgi:hypothetical protein